MGGAVGRAGSGGGGRSSTITILGWIVTFRNAQRLEQVRRDEKVRDFQIALRAEIASELMSLEVVDLEEHLRDIESRYAEDKEYSVLVSRLSPNLIFDSLVAEIHILPGAVIGPVVNYARLRQTAILFAEDLRGEKFPVLAAERQLSMYADYLGMLKRLSERAQTAATALDRGVDES